MLCPVSNLNHRLLPLLLPPNFQKPLKSSKISKDFDKAEHVTDYYKKYKKPFD